METGLIRITLRTPLSSGKTGNFPVFDSVLLHRLGLLYDGDIVQAREHMPLDRHEAGFWLCGGGYVPGVRNTPEPEAYKVFRRLANDRTLSPRMDCTPRQLYSQINLMMGQETVATEWTYRANKKTPEIIFRIQGDLEQIERLMHLEPYIGPGHSVGLGEIDSVTVEAAEGDLRWLMTDARGQLTRPLPFDLAAELAVNTGLSEWGAIEAPYWHAGQERLRVMRPRPLGF